MSTFKDNLSEKIIFVNSIIKDYLPNNKGQACNLEDILEYSVMAGGKRLRAIMFLEAFRLFKQDNVLEHSIVYPYMSAVEFIHTYSLVHDDLPAMDNDMYRRGKLTTHAAFGEANGILAGDALLNYAFELMTSTCEDIDMSDSTKIEQIKYCVKAMSIIAKKSGLYGMIGGQMHDLKGEEGIKFNSAYEKESFISRTYALKTGCLFQAALSGGAALAGASAHELELLDKLGEYIGIAFQIRDDILDITGDERLGKDLKSDEKNNKMTWTSIHSLEDSYLEVKDYSNKAQDILQELPGDTTFLSELVNYLINREY